MFCQLFVKAQKEEGLTHAVIAENMGESEPNIKQYSMLLNSLVAQILDFAKAYQKDRATNKVARATFDFTEWWFRNSGIYTLPTYHDPRPDRLGN